MLKSIPLLASAALVAAQTSTSSQPCAVVSAALAKSTVVTALQAYNCLESVPVDTTGNSKLIDQLKNVWQFQSELIWLKNPGPSWEYGPLDIIGELSKVQSNLGSYKSEYDVQLAINNITVRTGNFHFNYMPDILQIFNFQRQFNVASISSNGSALPKLYVHDDVAALASGSNKVSDITQINGMNAYDYLLATSQSQYIDSDGRMNSMFSKGDTGDSGAFQIQTMYNGNSTDIKWSNGSTLSVLNVATSSQSFKGVTDGASFFKQFCTGAITGAQASGSSKDKGQRALLGAPYPPKTIPEDEYLSKRQIISSSYATSVVRAPSGVVAGYFLSGSGYSDIAVLKIISFENPDTSNNADDTKFYNDFQSTVASFLKQCASQKKQKLIIDLRENGGGATNLLLDAFMQLFPGYEPFSGQRYRAQDAFVKIGAAANEIYTTPKEQPKYQAYADETIQNSQVFRYWDWWHFRTAEGNNFSGWNEYKGPLNLNGDQFTATNRYNYSNADRVSILPDGFYFSNVTGSPVFNSSNVIIYSDGLCGSSCASFHEELKNIAGVRAVAVGGRPQNKPMQTITGSKGGEVIPLINFVQYAQITLNATTVVGLTSIKSNDATLNGVANVPNLATRVGDPSSRAQSQDQIRKGDKTATPLQYIYEAADCRIFYTANTYSDPNQAWQQAWDAFSDSSKCVSGSIGHNSSISGGYKPYGPGPLNQADEPTSSGSSSSGGSGSGSGSGGNKKNDATSMKTGSLVVAIAAAVIVTML